MGLTYKKILRHPTANASARQAFQKKKTTEKKVQLFFYDSGFPNDATRTHGYSPKCQRCFGLKNGGAKGRTNGNDSN
ncbi:IS630 family transposase, partial [Sodalis-like symbiont of Philaenus spumarius]